MIKKVEPAPCAAALLSACLLALASFSGAAQEATPASDGSLAEPHESAEPAAQARSGETGDRSATAPKTDESEAGAQEAGESAASAAPSAQGITDPEEFARALPETQLPSPGASPAFMTEAEAAERRKRRTVVEPRTLETARSVISLARLVDSAVHKERGLALQRNGYSWEYPADALSKAQGENEMALLGSSRAERILALSWGLQDLPDLPQWPDVVVPHDRWDEYQQTGYIQTYKPVQAVIRTDNFMPYSASLSELNGLARRLTLRVPQGNYGVWRHMRFFTYVSETKGLLLPMKGKEDPGLEPVQRAQWVADRDGNMQQVQTPHICLDAQYLPVDADVAFVDSNGVIVDVKPLRAGSRVVYVKPDLSSYESVQRSQFSLEDTWKGQPPEVCSPYHTITQSQVNFVIMVAGGWFQRARQGPGSRVTF